MCLCKVKAAQEQRASVGRTVKQSKPKPGRSTNKAAAAKSNTKAKPAATAQTSLTQVDHCNFLPHYVIVFDVAWCIF